jgi:hypothetical protein
MKNLIVILFALLASRSFSQGFMTSKNIKFDLSGFVRNDFIFDSRRNVDAADQLFELYPQKPSYDASGKDLNAQASLKFINTFTRLGTRFSGLEIGKAQISAYIEVDFTGSTTTNSLNLRHAYTLFTWPKTKLLFGRTWHPGFVEACYPSVLNENTGAPYQLFNRTPQLRVTHQLSKDFDVIAAAVYQFSYASPGPNGKSYTYQRDAMGPNLHLQLQFHTKSIFAGAGIDWKSLQPRTYTEANNQKYRTTEKINSFSALAYLKITKGKFELKAKSMFGQNVAESLFPGGYAVASINPATGFETYTPTNHIFSFLDISYGSTWKIGLFAGHLKNLGTSKNPVGVFYASAPDMDLSFRISPRLIYTHKNLNLAWEGSATTATYGTIDYLDKGRIKDTKSVTNFRSMISVIYNF